MQWLILAMVIGCADITSEQACIEYYETACGCDEALCYSDVIDEDGSAAGYCAGMEDVMADESREHRREVICFLDTYAETCDDEAASEACQ